MKTLPILAAAAALAAGHALAQPTDVPRPACEPKPSYPGLKAMKSDVEVKAFEASMKNYKECVVKYISERKTSVKAHLEAENAAAKGWVGGFIGGERKGAAWAAPHCDCRAQ